MAHPFLLIDGYNLMHATGLARHSYGPGDLEACRNRLLQRLKGRLSEEAVQRTTVVFDAFDAVDGSNRRQIRHGLTVLYAPPGTDADSQLERLIARHSAPRQLLVVSSDHRLHRAARRRRAVAIDSEPFWAGLEPEQTPGSHQPDRPPPERDADWWLRDFFRVQETRELEASEPGDVFDADYLSDLESELDD